jgi:uncharacterized Zn finger protein
MIKKTEVKTFAERLYCDKCGEEMKFTGTVLCSHPPQYPHQCPNCGYRETTTTQYPHVYFETIGNKD